MKKALSFLILISIGLFSFIPIENTTIPSDDFCSKLKIMLEAAKEGFEPIKGEGVERMITGNMKRFYKSNTKFLNEFDCYVNDVSSYPECECILATDSRITESLMKSYDHYKSEIEKCLGEEWVITEQDSSNNFYLKGTKYKKLVIRENITGKKVKFHLYIYSSMIEKSRVIELKIEGIGKK